MLAYRWENLGAQLSWWRTYVLLCDLGIVQTDSKSCCNQGLFTKFRRQEFLTELKITIPRHEGCTDGKHFLPSFACRARRPEIPCTIFGGRKLQERYLCLFNRLGIWSCTKVVWEDGWEGKKSETSLIQSAWKKARTLQLLCVNGFLVLFRLALPSKEKLTHSHQLASCTHLCDQNISFPYWSIQANIPKHSGSSFS